MQIEASTKDQVNYERAIVNLLQKLKKDTVRRVINWDKYVIDKTRHEESGIYCNFFVWRHTCVFIGDMHLDGKEKCFNSAFVDYDTQHVRTYVKDGIFCTDNFPDESKLLLASVSYGYKEEDEGYEAYVITADNSIKPLCYGRKNADSYFYEPLKNLYEAINMAFTHISSDEELSSILNKYLEGDYSIVRKHELSNHLDEEEYEEEYNDDGDADEDEIDGETEDEDETEDSSEDQLAEDEYSGKDTFFDDDLSRKQTSIMATASDVEMRLEVLKRIKMCYKMNKAVYSEYYRSNKLYMSENQGCLYYLNEQEQAMVEKFEADGKHKVFHVLHYGQGGDELYALLFVSADKSQWSHEREEFAEHGRVKCYVYNRTHPIFSEFGSLAVCQTQGGLAINKSLFAHSL